MPNYPSTQPVDIDRLVAECDVLREDKSRVASQLQWATTQLEDKRHRIRDLETNAIVDANAVAQFKTLSLSMLRLLDEDYPGWRTQTPLGRDIAERVIAMSTPMEE